MELVTIAVILRETADNGRVYSEAAALNAKTGI